MFPVKGDVQACLVPCLARHLQRASFFFPCAKEAKCKRLCVYRINGWRRSPAGSPRQTVDDRGKEKLALNQRALCSETPQQTEAFSG